MVTHALAALDRAMGELRTACKASEDSCTPWTKGEIAARRVLTAYDAWREAAKMEGGGADAT